MHTSACSAELGNGWSYNSVFTFVFVLLRGATCARLLENVLSGRGGGGGWAV
jgi:hypothetical protein